MADSIGFIGIGNMGYRMAANLRTKMPPSATLFINDVVPSACDRFVQEYGNLGPITVLATPKEVANSTKTVITMVPSGKNVRQIYLDSETSIIQATKDADRLCLECSTIDIETTKDVGQKIMEAGVGTYIDAPVSGGVTGAAAGTLSFMIGTEAPASATQSPSSPANRAKQTISMMAHPEKIFFTGPLGTGLGAKIANNYIAITLILATAEGLAIGLRTGVDPKTLHNIVRASSGGSWHIEVNPSLPNVVPTAPSSNGFKQAFGPHMAVKDLTLGIETARSVGIEPQCAAAAVETYKRAVEDERTKDLDCTAVWMLINESNSLNGTK